MQLTYLAASGFICLQSATQDYADLGWPFRWEKRRMRRLIT